MEVRNAVHLEHVINHCTITRELFIYSKPVVLSPVPPVSCTLPTFSSHVVQPKFVQDKYGQKVMAAPRTYI